MNNSQTVNNIIDINQDLLDTAATLLTAAFSNDPLIKYLFPEPALYNQIWHLFHFVCEARLELGWPIMGIYNSGKLSAVACLSPPRKKEWPDSLVKKYHNLKSSIGVEAFDRLGSFSQLSKKHAPVHGHYYLASIGVLPELQGKGLGGILLEAIHGFCEKDPEATGVYLETASRENVRFYIRHGYQLVASDKLDGITDLWYMFRQNNVNRIELILRKYKRKNIT
jgi:ribosomal protein S18 acetylase RimI-like enzyme